jgi:hypothetical protein
LILSLRAAALRGLLFMKYTFALASDYELRGNHVKGTTLEFMSCSGSHHRGFRNAISSSLADPFLSNL